MEQAGFRIHRVPIRPGNTGPGRAAYPAQLQYPVFKDRVVLVFRLDFACKGIAGSI